MRSSWKAFDGMTSAGSFPRVVIIRRFGMRLEHNVPWAAEGYERWKRRVSGGQS